MLRSFLVAVLFAGLLPSSLPAAVADGTDVAAVRRLLAQDSPSARAAALRRLAGRAEPAAVDVFLAALDDDHPYVREAAASLLGALDEGSRARAARRLDRLRSPRARAAAATTALLWGEDRGHALLRTLATDGDALVRAAAVRALEAREEDAQATAALRERLEDADALVRSLALDALVARGEARADELARARADPDPRGRLAGLEGSVALALASRDVGAAAVAARVGLDDAVWSVRLAAAELASGIPDRDLLAPLVTTLGDGRWRVREAAHTALVGLTGIPFDPDPRIWAAWLEGDGRDFDPRVRAGGAGGPAGGGARSPPRAGQTIALPRFLDLPLASRHLAFVLDASASMARRRPDGRRRWDAVVAELDRALEQVGDAEVNVLVFAREVESLHPSAVRLTPARRKAIRRRLEAIEPGGPTALYDAIAAALADETVDTLVLLSDGAPSAGLYFTKTALLREVERRNRFRRARIDVLQIGGEGVAARWRDALRRISASSGGRFLAR